MLRTLLRVATRSLRQEGHLLDSTARAAADWHRKHPGQGTDGVRALLWLAGYDPRPRQKPGADPFNVFNPPFPAKDR